MLELHRHSIRSLFDPPVLEPYPGLRPFRREEAGIFFGREKQVDDVIQRLRCNRMVVVSGESGCGKSSLVYAGVLPALEDGFAHGTSPAAPAARGSEVELRRPEGPASTIWRWRVAELRPGNRPICSLAAALATALLPELRGDDHARSAELFDAQLRHGPRSIARILADSALPPDTAILILVDQFEELIRFRDRSDPHEADAFVELLLHTIADPSIPARLILTLRADYLGSCAIFPGLPEVINDSQYLVPRLGRDELLETIVAPAKLFHGDVDSILANQLINDVSQRQDQLPVLEYTLLSMWKQCCQPDTAPPDVGAGSSPIHLELATYTELGGMSAAISKHADNAYNALPSDEERRIARRLFCSLWDEAACGGDTRRACTVGEAAAIAGVSTDALTRVADVFRAPDRSFLTPPAKERLTEDRTLDVCHESLFRHWHLLKEWIQAEARDVQEYRRWCGLAAAHLHKGGDLLRDRMLDQAIEWRDADLRNAAWAQRYPAETTFEKLGQFLTASQCAQEIRVRDEEVRRRNEAATRDAEQAQRRRARWISAMLAGLAIVLVLLLVVADLRSRRTETRAALQAEQLRQHRYSTAADAVLHHEPVRAVQLALQAQGSDPGPQAEAALHKTLRESRLGNVVVPSLGRFDDARFLATTDRILTVGQGDGLAIWDAHTGRRLRAFYGATPSRLAVSSTQRLAATASRDGSVDLWDLAAGQHRWSGHVQIARITDIAFSPSDSMIATASEDGSIVLWDVESGEARYSLIDHLGGVSAVAFSHDGERLATVGADGRVLLWDAETGKKLGLFAHVPKATKLAFQTTGGLLAISSENRVVLLDPITQREEGSLTHASRVTSVAFSANGRQIATTSIDGELRVWNAADRTQYFSVSTDVLPRDVESDTADRQGGSPGATFSPDGRQLVMIAADGYAEVWDTEAGGELRSFRAHDAPIRDIAYDRGTDRIATASDDGTAAIWDSSGKLVFRTPRATRLTAMDLSATGALMATSDGGSVTIWNVATGTPVVSEAPLQSDIRDLVLFHTQDRIAIGFGRRVGVWSIFERRFLFSVDTGAEVNAMALSPDDRVLASECTGIADGLQVASAKLCLWDAVTGARVAAISAAPPVPAAGDRGAVRGESPEDAQRFAFSHLQFTGNGGWLVSSSTDRAIRLWDIRGRRLMTMLRADRGKINAVAISADGRMVISGSDDSTRVWDTRTRAVQDNFPDVEYGADSVAFSRNRSGFATGGHDGVVRIYAVDNDLLQAEARDRLPLRLPDIECVQDVPDPCPLVGTARELANEGRRLLRSGPSLEGERRLADAMLRDPANFGDERTRLASAQLVQHATRAIQTPLNEAVLDWTSVDVHREDGSVRFGRVLADALRNGAPRSVAILDHARQLAPEIILDPVDATARTSAILLTATARLFVDGGFLTLATTTLAQVPGAGASSNWPEDTATEMADLNTIERISRHLVRGECDAALGAIPLLSLRKRSPQRLVLLRFMATACDDPTQLAAAARLAERLYPLVDDVEGLIGLAEILLRTGKNQKALAALRQALDTAPTNDQALLLLARAQYETGQQARAAATLKKVSPLAPIYKDAVGLTGMILYDKLERLNEAYRSMLVAVDPKDPASWARLAEAAWATNRFTQAHQIARRVLEARTLAQSSPEVQLAMQFVLVATLCQARKFADAERGLDALIALVPSVQRQLWSYAGSHAAVSRIRDTSLQPFLEALLDYAESLGRTGDPDQLRKRLHDARDAAR